MARNRELLLALPLALGAGVLLFLSSERSMQREGRPLASAQRAPIAFAPGSLPSSAQDTAAAATDDAAAATRSRAGDAANGAVPSASATALEVGSRSAPGTTRSTPSGPRRPGGSHLYDGTRARRGRVPSALVGSTVADTKALQLERSDDVAEKRGSIVGAIVSVDATAITGWAYDWNDLDTVVNVDVFVDNQLVGTVNANAKRPDFDPSNPQNPVSSRAWMCPSPKELADGDRHWVAAYAYRPGSEARRVLQNSPWQVGGAPAPQGELDWVSDKMVYGWAADPSAPGKPVPVSIAADGKTLATLTTLGAGHNDEVFAKALALSPSQKSLVTLEGLGGPDDPELASAIQAKLQALAARNHYVDFRALATAGTDVAFDEVDFTILRADGSVAPLPNESRAAIKFAKPGVEVQAFLLAPSDPLVASWLQVRVHSADGTVDREAARSPMQLGQSSNKLPYGAVTFVSGNQISGYAVDQDVIPNPISIDVVIDGEYVGRFAADKKFDVIVNFAGVTEPMHGFTITPPDKYLDGKTHTCQVFAVNQPDGMNPELGGSPATFVGKRDAAPYGWLDQGDTTRIAGWAYDPDAGSSPTSVEVWIDGALWKTIAADQTRTDLVPIVAPEPTHGYSVEAPDALKDGKHHTIRVYAVDVPGGPKVELSASPRELNAQAPFIGIFPQDTPQGLTIADVISGSSGQAAGLAAGDVIEAWDDNATKVDLSAFVAWVQTKEVGEQVVFRLHRDPTLPAAPAPNPPAPGQASPPLAANERLVIVTMGSR